MANPVIVVNGTANFSQLNQALSQTDSRVSSSSSKWSKLGSVIKGAAVGAAAGVTALAAASFKLAQGAAEDEQAQVRLATALRNTTDARRKDVAGVEKYISAQGRALGVTDDELRPALGQLAAATGSVTKAQKLAAVALDISAGRGISLATVTKALERAQLGNVTSLGKLGVKTKDAEGETRSLQAITKELARTYVGQAAKAANTTAGKFDRLKLTADELGESIGARLLPYGEKLATVLLDKGVPAADALWRSFERNGIDGLVSKFDDLTGIDLSPYLDDAARAGEAVLRIVEELAPAFADTVAALPPILSPLELLADTLGIVADVAEAIPEPVKSIGIQAGLAALILPRLTLAVNATSTALTVAATRAIGFGQALRASGTAAQIAAFGRLASAARTAAGIGGILALSAASQSTSNEMKVLGSAAGGALLGFSLGGPFGAAIGAGAGALVGMSQATDKAAEAQDRLAAANRRVIATLDEQSGAFTRRTREMLVGDLADRGLLATAKSLGLNLDEVTRATLAGGSALQEFRVKAKDIVPYEQLTVLSEQLIPALQALSDEYRTGQRSYLLTAEAMGKTGLAAAKLRDRVQSLASEVGLLPRQARILIDAKNADKSRAEIRKLIAQMDLAPKQVTTLVALLGVDKARAGARAVRDGLEETGRAKPDLRPFTRGLEDALSSGKRTTSRGAADLVDLLRGGTRKARADLSGVAPSVRSGLVPARGAAATGGREVGAALKAGVIEGFSGTRELLSSQAAAAVSAAIAAAKSRGKVRSPSRETAYIGRMLGLGLEVGLKSTSSRVNRSGADLIAAALSGLSGSNEIDTAVGRVSDLVERSYARKLKASEKRIREQYKATQDRLRKTLNGKALATALDKAEREFDRSLRENERASERARRDTLRGLRDEYAALRKVGRQQDKNTEALEAAVGRYDALVEQQRSYANEIRQGFLSFGSVVGLGTFERGGSTEVSATRIVADLRDRLVQATRYADLVRQLQGKLNDTSLQQIIDAGVSGGLATAEAITAGGQATISEINRITQQLEAQGAGLGTQLGSAFYQAGIDQAAAIVAGLRKRQAQLDAIADRIGQQIVKTIREQIREPGINTRGTNRTAAAPATSSREQLVLERIAAAVERNSPEELARALNAPQLAGMKAGAVAAGW